MAKTKQPELLLQADMIQCLKDQGFFCDKTSDRFKAGKPDLRIGSLKWGPLDVELKFCTLPMADLWLMPGKGQEFNTGLTKLQKIKLKEMNLHGIPAIGLVYLQAMDCFIVTNFLRDILPCEDRRVTRGPHKGNVIDGNELMATAMNYLKGCYD